MASLVQKLLGWLRILPPPRPDGSDRPRPDGVADAELDGRFLVKPRSPDRPGATAPDRRASRFGNASWHYGAWRKYVLMLASGAAPDGLVVGHSLSLAKLRIRSLPAGLTVRGDLDLRQCQRLSRIGDRLVVEGDLLIGGRCLDTPWWETPWLEEARNPHIPPLALHTLSRDGQCPLAALPAALRVGGDLRVRNCRRLERLPDDLHAARSIELAGCTALARLPDAFAVHGDLTILSAPSLTSLPEGLCVKRSLRLIGARVDRLPEGLAVGGDLVLECCPRLTDLPEGLAVGGSLVVRRCPIARLPEGLRVGRDLRLHRIRDLEQTPAGLSVPGRVELIDCPALRRIGPGLRVGADLNLRRCPVLRELPEGLVVAGTLDLRGSTALEQLPAGMNLGSALARTPFVAALRLADCPALTSLPDDLVLGGPIEVAGSGLRERPERLATSARLLWRGVLVPPEVIFRPESLAPEVILGQPNAELRRVILERVGLENVLRRAGAEVVDSDRDPGGARRLVQVGLPARFRRVARHRYLHCRCPSTGREYLLRVPRNTRTCREAAAWLAGFDDPDAYRPIQET
jgi:hypothetical protein